MCDYINEYIKETINKISYTQIYNDLIKDNDKSDIEFIFLITYDIDINNEMQLEYELKEKRHYQKELREKALKFYNNKCVISKIDRLLCLQVAHIKPVCECINNSEKKDVENTLLLCLDLHQYFDNYYISVNPYTSCVEVNKYCNDYNYLKQYENIKLNLTDKNIMYLQHHYNKFLNNNLL